MGDSDELYSELKDDLQCLAGPSFDLAEQQLGKRGGFLPFGASLSDSGEVTLQAASDGQDVTSTLEVLPLLHEALREVAAQGDTSAVAVCEWVKIAPEDGRKTDAIKVLVEHVRGLSVAFYLPCNKKFLGGWQCGDMMVVPAEPEVRGWSAGEPI